MSDLQSKVYLAITSHSTPEEQTDAAIRAIIRWSFERCEHSVWLTLKREIREL